LDIISTITLTFKKVLGLNIFHRNCTMFAMVLVKDENLIKDITIENPKMTF
jgi:hypothetical protein